MKRSIHVDAGGIRITATINSGNHRLTRDEVEAARDELADQLMRVASQVRYFDTPLSRVKVK
jgi:predicted NBD/HSP70 family sugar kinase